MRIPLRFRQRLKLLHTVFETLFDLFRFLNRWWDPVLAMFLVWQDFFLIVVFSIFLVVRNTAFVMLHIRWISIIDCFVAAAIAVRHLFVCSLSHWRRYWLPSPHCSVAPTSDEPWKICFHRHSLVGNSVAGDHRLALTAYWFVPVGLDGSKHVHIAQR